MSTETRDMCRQHAESTRDLLESVWNAIDLGVDEYEGQDPIEYLEELPLEIVNRRGAAFQVVLGTGGPDVRIVAELDDDGDVTGDTRLEVAWSSDSYVTRSTHIDRTAEHFAEVLKYA